LIELVFYVSLDTEIGHFRDTVLTNCSLAPNSHRMCKKRIILRNVKHVQTRQNNLKNAKTH